MQFKKLTCNEKLVLKSNNKNKNSFKITRTTTLAIQNENNTNIIVINKKRSKTSHLTSFYRYSFLISILYHSSLEFTVK
jgi:hypothetical protein